MDRSHRRGAGLRLRLAALALPLLGACATTAPDRSAGSGVPRTAAILAINDV